MIIYGSNNGGKDGLSAYDIAIEEGFVGTKEEWLLSLKGATGSQGVQGAIGVKGDKGDTGSKGQDGDKGADGVDGFPTEEQWNELLARVTALETV